MVKSQRAMNKGAWSAEEDRRLSECIKIHGDKKWKTIPARAGLNRCGKSCRLRWLNYLRPDIKRGNISEDEEDLIMRLHNLLGNRWSLIAGRLPGRTDNEIKNYWNTHLCKKSLSMNELNDKNKSNGNRSQKSLPTCTTKAGPAAVSSNPGETDYEKVGALQSQKPWLADHLLVQDLDFDPDADIDRFFYFAGSDKKVWEMNGGMFFSEMLDYGLQMPSMELEFLEPNFYQNEFGSFEQTAGLRDGYEQPSSF